MSHSSVIEISKKALSKNILFARSIFGEEVRISSVIKANAYGHGIEPFVPIALEAGIDHFSVFSSTEAKKVKKIVSDNVEIMIMGWMSDKDIEWVIKNDVQFYVFNIERLQKTIIAAKKLKIKAKVHIEVETGMNRTGFSIFYLSKVISLIQENSDCLIIKGLCTHYAGAESIANYLRIKKQISKFNSIYKRFLQHSIFPEIRHTACSAASITYPQTRMDMVRLGILQYGYWPSKETFIQYISKTKQIIDPIDRIIRWKSSVMSIKKVKTGEFVSYGTTFLAQEEKVIAVVPVGYSGGYSRSLSNQGRVLIRGQRVGVIGLVNMNMLIADVTQVNNITVGDEVVLIGKQDDLEITVHSFSELSDQLNYELLTSLPSEIPRIIKD